jgi:glycosyltransferase involved in cell wall biosynthesis
MWKVMKLSSLSVLPSVCNEAALMTTIESMAASVPVITLDAGGITEYAHKEVCTVLKWSKNIVHDLAGSILKLIENEERRNSMKIQAYNHVQKFGLSSYYNHFCDIMEEIHQRNQ